MPLSLAHSVVTAGQVPAVPLALVHFWPTGQLGLEQQYTGLVAATHLFEIQARPCLQSQFVLQPRSVVHDPVKILQVELARVADRARHLFAEQLGVDWIQLVPLCLQVRAMDRAVLAQVPPVAQLGVT